VWPNGLWGCSLGFGIAGIDYKYLIYNAVAIPVVVRIIYFG
jgi:hypothetical protein